MVTQIHFLGLCVNVFIKFKAAEDQPESGNTHK